jgi:hypothetical protein
MFSKLAKSSSTLCSEYGSTKTTTPTLMMATIGLHADLVCSGEEHFSYGTRRSSVQVAQLDVEDGKLVCDRDLSFELKLVPLSSG